MINKSKFSNQTLFISNKFKRGGNNTYQGNTKI